MAAIRHILHKDRPKALRALCAQNMPKQLSISESKSRSLPTRGARFLLLSVVLWKRLVVVFFSKPPWTVADRQAALSKLSHKKTPSAD
jgi:hypothetical protein